LSGGDGGLEELEENEGVRGLHGPNGRVGRIKNMGQHGIKQGKRKGLLGGNGLKCIGPARKNIVCFANFF
jgi:hypothetical protein